MTVWVTLGTWHFSSNLYLGFCAYAHILPKRNNTCLCTDTLQEGVQEKWNIWLIHYAYLTAPQTTKLKKINTQDYSR